MLAANMAFRKLPAKSPSELPERQGLAPNLELGGSTQIDSQRVKALKVKYERSIFPGQVGVQSVAQELAFPRFDRQSVKYHMA
jgi:hypothetical protein